MREREEKETEGFKRKEYYKIIIIIIIIIQIISYNPREKEKELLVT